MLQTCQPCCGMQWCESLLALGGDICSLGRQCLCHGWVGVEGCEVQRSHSFPLSVGQYDGDLGVDFLTFLSLTSSRLPIRVATSRYGRALGFAPLFNSSWTMSVVSLNKACSKGVLLRLLAASMFAP